MNGPSPTFSCLIIEDDVDFARMLGDVVKDEGGEAVTCGCLRDARKRMAERPFDVLVLDNHLPDGKGFRFFLELAGRDPSQTVIVLTGIPELSHAVELTRHGLFDYLAKPISEDAFAACLKRAVTRNRFRYADLGAQGGDLLLANQGMRAVAQALEQVARHPTTTALLTGETGVGKDVAARALHRLTHSGRSPESPFVPVNCAAVPADMFEAELFGCEKGAYTGADRAREGFVGAAKDGTLFLDEIAEVPLVLQAKLLRFLESREYRNLGSTITRTFHGRVIAATNKSLSGEAARGAFRQDLLYRLDVARIEIPPLRERKEEIPALAGQLLAQIAAKYQRTAPRLKTEDLAHLVAYAYPGNVRELRNLLERSLLRTPTDAGWLALDLAWLSSTPGTVLRPGSVRSSSAASTAPDLKPMEASEYEVIRSALIESRGGIRRAAAKLGISHQVILRRLRKWPELRAAGRETE